MITGTRPQLGDKLAAAVDAIDRIGSESLNVQAPCRVVLSRKKGWRMPENTRIVDRRSIFGNPFRVSEWGQRDAVVLFRRWLEGADVVPPVGTLSRDFVLDQIRRELRGKNLACWCKEGAPCHADVLLEIANKAI